MSNARRQFSPAIRIALVSMLICGLFFPLLITGIAQVTMPYQANGDLAKLNGRTVGSYLIDNNFTLPVFFHARNNSASGVDPDITLSDANSQVARISNATGIPMTSIQQLVNDNVEGVYWIFGSPYVNVLKLNLALINNFPSTYDRFINAST